MVLQIYGLLPRLYLFVRFILTIAPDDELQIKTWALARYPVLLRLEAGNDNDRILSVSDENFCRGRSDFSFSQPLQRDILQLKHNFCVILD